MITTSELQTLRDILLLLGAAVFTLTLWLITTYCELKQERKRYSKMFLTADEKRNAKILKAIQDSVNQDLMLQR